MFNNIGLKIKTFAEIISIVCIIVSLLYGLSVLANNDVLIGVVIMIGGSISAWISALCIYGFGQLIENSDIIREAIESLDEGDKVHIANIPMNKKEHIDTVTYNKVLYDESATNDIVAKMIEGKKETINNLFQSGEISDEEYKKLLEDLEH